MGIQAPKPGTLCLPNLAPSAAGHHREREHRRLQNNTAPLPPTSKDSSSPPRAPGLSATLGETDTQDSEARPLGLPRQASDPAPSLLTALSPGLSCQVQSAQLGHHPSGAPSPPRGQTRCGGSPPPGSGPGTGQCPFARTPACGMRTKGHVLQPRLSGNLWTQREGLGVTAVLRPNFHKP